MDQQRENVQAKTFISCNINPYEILSRKDEEENEINNKIGQ